MKRIITKILGTRNGRVLSDWQNKVVEINKYGDLLSSSSDEDLSERIRRLREDVLNGKSESDALVECFALVREISARILGMRHFDVQLLGGIALWSGKIAEMRTGEGKTLVATLPVILSAMSGKGVHVATANDYLASRDAALMSPLYEAFGFSVGVTSSGMSNEEKIEAYKKDITYGTANEFGFDWLRDRMIVDISQKIQSRGLNFCIVDEVDSILIDEARTPLIISGDAARENSLLDEANVLATKMVGVPLDENQKVPPKHADFLIDMKTKDVFLTEKGHERVEDGMRETGMIPVNGNPYTSDNMHAFHAVVSAIRAHNCFEKDKDYVVLEDKVVIVDEFTGRMSQGRRWQDGLHEAIEIKEGLVPENETRVLGSITFQNYFRMYGKLAGMTGTADTEAHEFHEIYGLETIVIPTNKRNLRKDSPDLIFRTSAERNVALAKRVETEMMKGRPVLIGTSSIADSELVSNALTEHGIPHSVLNAKHHGQEADIIAEAGMKGRVTVSTNMAGRGTDICLGGVRHQGDEVDSEKWKADNAAVLSAGGLLVIGTSRHESRRVDNQLRGRCARQGDPGETVMYLSLEDPVMKLFGGDRVANLLQRMNHPSGEPLSHPLVTKAMESAQRRVEGHNFGVRKHLLSYDDVLQEQRLVFYAARDCWLVEASPLETLLDFAKEAFVENMPDANMGLTPMDWRNHVLETWEVDFSEEQMERWMDESSDGSPSVAITEFLLSVIKGKFREETASATASFFAKSILLSVWDDLWRSHISAMDHIRQSIGLRAYAQKDPKKEYKEEAYKSFAWMASAARKEIAKVALSFKVLESEDLSSSTLPPDITSDIEDASVWQKEEMPSMSRNEPCPCGSGLRYKHCHGKLG